MLIRIAPALILLFLSLAAPARAEEDLLLGRYGSWEAHKLTRDSGTTCYAIAKPKTTLPKKLNRDEAYFMVTNWADRESKAEPSIVAGYAYEDGSTATVTVKKGKFGFFTKGDGAWLAAAKDELRLIAAMKTAKTMEIRGTSMRGTKTTDSYSLSGFGTALDKIGKACK